MEITSKNVLIAEDYAPTRMLLESLLEIWGYTVTSACDGNETWDILCEPEHPHLLILDWMMPGIDGPEIVRRLHGRTSQKPYYTIIQQCPVKDLHVMVAQYYRSLARPVLPTFRLTRS